MARSKKRFSGDGWSFVPADSKQETAFPVKPMKDQSVVVRLEKRARGKAVTRISEWMLEPETLKALAKAMKKKTGGGGTSGANWIELQGDHRETVRKLLKEQGVVRIAVHS